MSGKQHAIRLRDRNNKFRKEFTSLRWYPIDSSYRVTADFFPYKEEGIAIEAGAMKYRRKGDH